MKNVSIASEYFIVTVRCREMKDTFGQGHVVTADDTEVVLCTSQNHPQCYQLCDGVPPAEVSKFPNAEAARENWRRWDGMPWYFKFKPETVMVWRVREVHAVSFEVQAAP